MKTSVCRTLVADILEPATMDYDGTTKAFFTPSASASGYAFDIDHTEDAWQRFHWTMLENPHLPKAKEWLRRESTRTAGTRRHRCTDVSILAMDS